MAKSNNTLSRKTLSALADVWPDDVSTDANLSDNLTNILSDFEALGDLLSSFCSLGQNENREWTVRHIGCQMERRARAAKDLLNEWGEAKHKRSLKVIPGGAP